jgi:hypothetical protein
MVLTLAPASFRCSSFVGVLRLRELIPESCWSLLDTASLLEAAASPAVREGLRLPPYAMSR